jgi:SAM-dependent methyltransferase
MINDIVTALSKKDYYALALHDYLDLIQYLSAGAIKETPAIQNLRRALLIEKGYEKCGHFFKARIAEFNHLMPDVRGIAGFGHDRLYQHLRHDSDLSEEGIIKILRQEARFIFFHGMARPAYKELLYFDKLRKAVPTDHILDYCSDNADLGLYCALRGLDVTLAHVDGPLLNALTRRFALRKAKLRALPINEAAPCPELAFNQYNVIFANDSLLNTTDPLSLLEEFRTALKGNGLLVLSRYPFATSPHGLSADSAARRKTIIDYMAKHFAPTSISEIFKKI